MNSILHYEQYFKQPEIACQASETERSIRLESSMPITNAHGHSHKVCTQLYPDLPIVTTDLEETSIEYAPLEASR